ncbi:hypothetical protein ACTNDY_00630 [Tissierellaceae bacterium HCP3S3_D8]
MENKNAMSEIIKQAKKIEENNFNNMEFATSMTMLINSNDLAQPKDRDLADKVNRLNRHIEDINKLTDELLQNLISKHN